MTGKAPYKFESVFLQRRVHASEGLSSSGRVFRQSQIDIPLLLGGHFFLVPVDQVVREMRRVTRGGGTVAAGVVDFGGGFAAADLVCDGFEAAQTT